MDSKQMQAYKMWRRRYNAVWGLKETMRYKVKRLEVEQAPAEELANARAEYARLDQRWRDTIEEGNRNDYFHEGDKNS